MGCEGKWGSRVWGMWMRLRRGSIFYHCGARSFLMDPTWTERGWTFRQQARKRRGNTTPNFPEKIIQTCKHYFRHGIFNYLQAWAHLPESGNTPDKGTGKLSHFTARRQTFPSRIPRDIFPCSDGLASLAVRVEWQRPWQTEKQADDGVLGDHQCIRAGKER